MSYLLRAILILSVGYMHCHLITVQSRNDDKENLNTKCNNITSNGLIEHFFNVVFNEFQSTKPACICIQMCPGQATYCYPNRCLKGGTYNKKRDVTRDTSVNDYTQPILIIHEKSNFMNEIIDKESKETDKKAAEDSVRSENSLPFIFRPRALRDRYNMLFKFEKLPKLELSNTIAEKVKHTKTFGFKRDIDSKTRWHNYKINQPFHNRHSDPMENTKLFMSLLLEKPAFINMPKYYKRDLANNVNNDKNAGMLIMNRFKNTTAKNNSNSLKKMQNGLSEVPAEATNIKWKNSTGNNTMNKDSNNEIGKHDVKVAETIAKEEETEIPTTTMQVFVSETTNMVPINANENHDNSMNNFNRTTKLSELIASVSKDIDLTNKTNLEIMRRMLKNLKLNSQNKYQRILNLFNTTTTTEKLNVSIENDIEIKKKSKVAES